MFTEVTSCTIYHCGSRAKPAHARLTCLSPSSMAGACCNCCMCCAQDLKSSVKKLLKLFYNSNRQKKPHRIIFMRDGVSEGQFPQVWTSFK